MDVRKNDERIRLTYKDMSDQDEQIQFEITYKEMMVILAAAGKQVTIMLTDIAGECWQVDLETIQIRLDIKNLAMEMTTSPFLDDINIEDIEAAVKAAELRDECYDNLMNN